MKFPKLLSCPPRFATFIFILVMPVPVQVTPCQPSPQGSPPFGIHPGRLGDPSETYSPFIAITSEASVTARAPRGANAAAATSSRTSSTRPPPPHARAGARLVISARQFTPSGAPSSPLPATRARGAGARSESDGNRRAGADHDRVGNTGRGVAEKWTRARRDQQQVASEQGEHKGGRACRIMMR